MNITLEAEEFWEAFCEHNAVLNKEELYYDVWQFLDGKRGCDRLASLCLAGIKTATSSVSSPALGNAFFRADSSSARGRLPIFSSTARERTVGSNCSGFSDSRIYTP